MTNQAYDDFSSDYDRFVNWTGRLALELPFLEQQIRLASDRPAPRLLDAACGTGMHTIALAQRGFQAAGADLSAGMIAMARANAAAAGVEIPFAAVGFGSLAAAFGIASQEAVICLGNSLPHVLNPADLQAALADFGACLKPGGILILQNRNFDAVMSARERWMEPQNQRSGDQEWVFLRFYDFETDGSITFHIITLHRSGIGGWQQHITSTRLRPLRQNELVTALAAAGFELITCYGSLTGTPFEPFSSGNLVVTCRRGT